MSGGSYNYLYKWPETGSDAIDMARMAVRLVQLGYDDAAAATEEILRLAGSLAGVWQAVEWADSGDWGEDEIRDAVTKFRESR